MLKIIDCIQGSQEWLDARAGRVTASRIKDILTKVKTGEAAARRDYRLELVCEILTGIPAEQGFVSFEMKRGTELEPAARAAYEFENKISVDQVGMVLHPQSDRYAASPDGMVNWDGKNAPEGLIEIKAPKTATHIGYIEAGVVPADYQPQMLWQMACTGAQWVDFVSYDPRLPEQLELYIVRFQRDEARVHEIESEVMQFLKEVDAAVSRITALGQAA